MNNNLLIIFTRNPELGKVKTRLAVSVGDSSALEIYKFLLNHTVSITKKLNVNKQVHYSAKVRNNDLWDESVYTKKLQSGEDLGIKMNYAFQQGFEDGFNNIIIIGSDMYDMSQQDLEEAFLALQNHDYVIGPAKDGGYYLIGMKKLNPTLFRNKNWGTNTVLKDTLKNLKNESLKILPQLNDVDNYLDIKEIDVFQQFLKNTKEETS